VLSAIMSQLIFDVPAVVLLKTEVFWDATLSLRKQIPVFQRSECLQNIPVFQRSECLQNAGNSSNNKHHVPEDFNLQCHSCLRFVNIIHSVAASILPHHLRQIIITRQLIFLIQHNHNQCRLFSSEGIQHVNLSSDLPCDYARSLYLNNKGGSLQQSLI
jgi:hypothetical protein